LTHPAVAEAATFGAPDAKYGEEVHAAVVLKADATEADLLAHCRSRLADFKAPKVVYITKELPKGPTGKVQRRHLASFFLPSAGTTR
jgi:acyl-coenzyme A synthetase/AMP-(fatty) acid ligase